MLKGDGGEVENVSPLWSHSLPPGLGSSLSALISLSIETLETHFTQWIIYRVCLNSCRKMFVNYEGRKNHTIYNTYALYL